MRRPEGGRNFSEIPWSVASAILARHGGARLRARPTPIQHRAMISCTSPLAVLLAALPLPAQIQRPPLAAALGSPEKVEALLAGGADAAQTDAEGRTAAEVCRTLVEESAAEGEDDFVRALEACAAALAR